METDEDKIPCQLGVARWDRHGITHGDSGLCVRDETGYDAYHDVIGIILFREKKYVLLLGVLTGIISGLTTSFPGGFFPNIIDKCITSFAFYGLLLASGKLAKKLPALIVFTAVGTLISGIIFLGSAFFIAGLPGPFAILFGTVVLPTTALNAVAMFILFPIVSTVAKRTNAAHSMQA